MNPILLAAGRQLTAGIILLPLCIREIRRDPDFHWKNLLSPLIPGVLLGIHFITWIGGARLIPAANATLIVNLTPAVTPFLLFFMAREKVNKWEGLGSILAIGGSIVLALSDMKLNREYFTGDLICLASMLTYAIYLVYSKRSMNGIWSYLVPLYLTGGLLCFAASFITTNPFKKTLTSQDWIAILGMGILSTVGGHSIMNWAMKHLRGQLVSLFHTTQFIFAGILGLMFFGEIPKWNFLLAGFIIITGLLLPLILSGPHKEEYPQPQKH